MEISIDSTVYKDKRVKKQQLEKRQPCIFFFTSAPLTNSSCKSTTRPQLRGGHVRPKVVKIHRFPLAAAKHGFNVSFCQASRKRWHRTLAAELQLILSASFIHFTNVNIGETTDHLGNIHLLFLWLLLFLCLVMFPPDRLTLCLAKNTRLIC